jgi:N-acetylmuramoyl-L-alanine amidase
MAYFCWRSAPLLSILILGPKASTQSFSIGAYSMNHPGFHPRTFGVTSLLAAALLALAVAQPALAQVSKPASKTPAAATCDRAHFRVIIDVGHSEEVPGAMSARGVPEYSYNLNLAKKVHAKLQQAGFSKAQLLITPGKAIAGLVSRVSFATHNPADLFLAIHHDAVPDKFLEKWTYEGKPHNYCDRFKGHSIFVSRYNADYQSSLLFGRLLGRQLKAQGMQYASHYTEKFMGIRQRELVDADAGVYRFDNLVVLMSTNMPAVLFEAGSIINRDEELLMESPEHQAVIASAVTTAVESFCTAQAAHKPEQRIARRPLQAQVQVQPPSLFPMFFSRPAQ